MRRVLIGELGAIVRLGLEELLKGDGDCEIVDQALPSTAVLETLDKRQPDVVLLDLDDRGPSYDLAVAIVRSHPRVKVIACSSIEPRMRVFPPFHGGESYVARMSPDLLIEAVKRN